MKTSLTAKLLLSFRKLGSLNLIAMSEFRTEAVKCQFVRMRVFEVVTYIFDQKSPEHLARRQAASSCNTFALHVMKIFAMWPRIGYIDLINLIFDLLTVRVLAVW